MNEETVAALRALQSAHGQYTKAVAAELGCDADVVELLRRVSVLDDVYEVAGAGADTRVIANEAGEAWQHSPEKLRAAAQVALLRIDRGVAEFADLLADEFGADAELVLRAVTADRPAFGTAG